MTRMLFVHNAGEAGRVALEKAARIAGPSWIVDANSLSSHDLERAGVLALGGRLDEAALPALIARIAPLAAQLAGLPFALFSAEGDSPSGIEAPRSALTAALGREPALVVDIGRDPVAAGRALRRLKDEVARSAMPPAKVRGLIDEFLAARRTCALATCGPEGIPRATPIEYLWRDGGFLFFSEGGLKFAGLADGSRVSLCVYDEYSSMAKVRGLQVSGRARLLAEGSGEWRAAFAARGVDPEALAHNRLRLNVFRVDPELFELLDASLAASGADSRQLLAP